ncbi:hypothetical protein B0H17DRAFT_1337476 [Mycena rosella]|uniref:Uncharacterized protein n=1 Tax=Mycena rosella TaxID=1033263 RepID=A0AAD7CRQ7_MYCRO|nr:hypothetical protein B0H17DRAFT_1337476 [Mycena rosella]
MSLLTISYGALHLATTTMALLIGTYDNLFLYILEVVEVIKYFRRLAYRDPVVIRAMVLLALATDSLDTAGSDAIKTVTHWGDEAISNTRSVIVSVTNSRITVILFGVTILTSLTATVLFTAVMLPSLLPCVFAIATLIILILDRKLVLRSQHLPPARLHPRLIRSPELPRQSLPPTIQIPRYPFMLGSPDNTVCAEAAA